MRELNINGTELKIFGSDIDEAVIEETIEMIKGSPTLFKGETVVLMPDAHSTGDTPVGFTCTCRNGLMAPDLVSADISCGMSSILIENYVPAHKTLVALGTLMRDIVPINRKLTYDKYTELTQLTCLGTLGGGNHFVEVGSNGRDTLITVHSGSRSVGGDIFRFCKNRAKEYNRAKSKEELKEEINKRKQNIPNEDIPALIEQIRKENKRDLLPSIPVEQVRHLYESADNFAKSSREEILTNVVGALKDIDVHAPDAYRLLVCTHNYIDFSEEIPVVRKGSIKATDGTDVIIPLNMRDGIIVGKAVNTDKLNSSLPHGAGRKKSRTAFRKEFTLEEYEKEMVGIIAPSLSEATLDEAPSAYKNAETIIEDIALYIEDFDIFAPLLNYKGE